MNKVALVRFLKSTSSRLAITYLSIIMLMSVSFSIVFFNASSHQLGRQIPPSSTHGNRQTFFRIEPDSEPINFDDFFHQRIEEGRHALIEHLLWLNLAALIIGSFLSYYLARLTLRPIEDAMDAQNRFVSDASHELRTPITALQTTNEVALRKEKLSTAEAKDLIKHNVQEAIKLKNLSDGLLGLLKQDSQPYKLIPVSLQDIVIESMNQVLEQASLKNIAVDDNVPMTKVLVDKHAVIQVLTILLDNAIKYSPTDSTIVLTAEVKTGNVFLQVQDHGLGIKASDLPHIFERFYRADHSRTGSSLVSGYGLGLSIAQKIMSNIGGEITVKSTPDHGSTFTVKLPST